MTKVHQRRVCDDALYKLTTSTFFTFTTIMQYAPTTNTTTTTVTTTNVQLLLQLELLQLEKNLGGTVL